MKMILHIFRKDVRHLYPEILAVCVLIVALGWAAPSQWIVTNDFLRSVTASIVRFLLGVAWLVLISQLVHEESLAGDREFWVTRPYRRGELLASKALFILCFVVIPFVLVRLYLLHHAGLEIHRSLGLLAISTATILFAFILPFTAIATVTTGLAKDVLFLLVGFVYAVAIAFLQTWLTDGREEVPYLAAILLTAAGLALGTVIVVQYASRRTRISRFVLLGLPVVILLIATVAPARLLMESAYPDSKSDLGQHLAFDPAPTRQQPGNHIPNVFGGQVYVEVPLKLPSHLDDVPPQILISEGVAVEINGARGDNWRSAYQRLSGIGNGIERIPFHVPVSVFERIRNSSSHLDAELPVEINKPDAGYEGQVSENDVVTLPGESCSTNSGETMLTCLYALNRPNSIRVETYPSEQPCLLSGETKDQAKNKNRMQMSSPSPWPFTWDFDPVVPMHIGRGHFCIGKTLKITTFTPASRERLHLAIDNIKLGDYVWSNPAHGTSKSY